MLIYIQKETYGEVKSKLAVNFTICGAETIKLKKEHEFETVKRVFEYYGPKEKIMRTEYEKMFWSSNVDCPAYKYELTDNAGQKLLSSFFSIDNNYDINFAPTVSPGIYVAFIHPVSHFKADSIRLSIDI